MCHQSGTLLVETMGNPKIPTLVEAFWDEDQGFYAQDHHRWTILIMVTSIECDIHKIPHSLQDKPS